MRGSAALCAAAVTLALLTVPGGTAAASATAAATAAAPVGTFQQSPAHDGLTSQNVSGDLHELWHRDFNGRPSFAAVADGRVFTVVGNYDRTDDTTLYAFELATGTMLWGPVDLGGHGDIGLPAYDAGRVYVIDGRQSVRAFDAATGTQLWAAQGPTWPLLTGAIGLVADGGVVYARDNAVVRALDGVTGTQLWRSTALAGGDTSMDVPTLTPDSVVTSGGGGEVASVDRTTGATRWRNMGCCYGGSGVEVAYGGGRLWTQRRLDTAPSRVLDAATGAVLAEVPFDGNPALAPERVVVRRGTTLVSLDPATYATQWTFDPPEDVVSAPVMTPDRVFVGAGSVLYALDRSTGAVESALDVGAPFAARPEGWLLQTQGITVADGTAVVTATKRLTVVAGPDRSAPPPPPPGPPLDGPRTGPERPPAATAWRSLRGDAGHSGAVPNESIETPLVHRWTADVGKPVRQVLAQDGRAFVATQGETWDTFDLRALDLRHGGPLWGPVRVRGLVGIDGTRLYHYGQDGAFHGIDTRTGVEVFVSDPVLGGSTGHVVATGGAVYSAGPYLVAADTATGDVRTVRQEGSSAPIAVGAGIAVTTDACSGVRAIELATGALRWSRPSNCYGAHSPSIASGGVYTEFRLDAEFRYDAVTGERTATRYLAAAPAVDGTTAIGITGYGLAAWDERTGARKWVTHDDGSLFGTPVVANGLVFAQSTGGAVHAYDEADGHLRWTHPGVGPTAGAPCCTPPPGLAVAQSQLIVPAGDKLALFGPADIPPPAPGVVPMLQITDGPDEGSWSGPSTRFAFATSAPAVTYSCFLDGAARACGESLALADLAAGTHQLRVSAVTSEGATPDAVRTWRVDAAAPVATTKQPTARWTLTGRAAVSWAATDNGSGVASYDVRVRGSSASSDLGAWRYPESLQRTTATSASLPVSPGHTVCWSARGRDAVGNVGAWSREACRSAPLDDRSFTGSGWTRDAVPTWYRGTRTATRTTAVTLAASSLRARRIALVAVRCPTCGVVRVRWRGVVVGTVDLRSATTSRSVVPVTVRPAAGSGTLRLEVVSATGRYVGIDGVGISPV